MKIICIWVRVGVGWFVYAMVINWRAGMLPQSAERMAFSGFILIQKGVSMMNKQTTLAAVLLAALGVSAPALATVTAYGSYEEGVRVGPTAPTLVPGHENPGGEPGIGVHNVANFTIVSFAGLQNYVAPDRNNVTVLESAVPESHNDMGAFNFGKLANADVYIGEWSQTGNVADGTHTVYYAGTDKTTTMPTNGRASYRVAGISGYNGNNLLTGTLNANFAQNSLSGSMSSGWFNRLSINARINSADASFAGSATRNYITSGQTQGHFFGNNAQSLAGVATFNDRANDVAFGGSRN